MKGIPVIPMIRVLKQFAFANNYPLDTRRWESILRCYYLYNETAQLNN